MYIVQYSKYSYLLFPKVEDVFLSAKIYDILQVFGKFHNENFFFIYKRGKSFQPKDLQETRKIVKYREIFLFH